MKKTYWTVLKVGPFGGTPSYYNTFNSEADVLAHFQALPGFVSAEVTSDNPEFRTLKVRFERVLFPTETYFYREAETYSYRETETYFYREAEYDGFVKADFSEMEARVVGKSFIE